VYVIDDGVCNDNTSECIVHEFILQSRHSGSEAHETINCVHYETIYIKQTTSFNKEE
jgi:hypothetical protein